MPQRLDEFSWEEIARMSKRHELQRGDTAQIQLTDGRTIMAEVIALDGDEYMGVKVEGTVFRCDGNVFDISHNEDPIGYLPSDIKRIICEAKLLKGEQR